MVARYAHQNGPHAPAAMDKLEARLGATSEPITLKLHKSPKPSARNIA